MGLRGRDGQGEATGVPPEEIDEMDAMIRSRGEPPQKPDPRTNEDRVIGVLGTGDSWRRIKDITVLLDEAEARGATKAAEVRQSVARLEVEIDGLKRALLVEQQTSHRSLVQSSQHQDDALEQRTIVRRLEKELATANGKVEDLTGRLAEALAKAATRDAIAAAKNETDSPRSVGTP